MRAQFLNWIMLSVALSACSTMADIVEHKHDGTTKVYDVNLDQAWEVAKVVLMTEGAGAIEEHQDRGYMLTSSGSNFYSSGAVIGAWIESAGADRMKVTVVTKRRVKTDPFITLTEGTFHRRFAQGVRIINAGHPLPLMLPDSYEVKRAPSAGSEGRALQAGNSENGIPASDASCRSPERPAQAMPVVTRARQ